MKTIQDVRAALWSAYQGLSSEKKSWGKAAEGKCHVIYPEIWNCSSAEQFAEPIGLEIYSYLLGPARHHFFLKGAVEKEVSYNHWEAPDFYEKAIKTIGEWVHRDLEEDKWVGLDSEGDENHETPQ